MSKYLLLFTLLFVGAFASTNEKVLENLSRMQYMKSYKDLDSSQKKKIDETYEKRERIGALAKEKGVRETKEFKEQIELISNELSMKIYLQNYRDSIKVSNEEIKKYYDKHLRDYTQVDAYTIVRSDKKDLEKYIKELFLVSNEKRYEVFTSLAKQHSQHPKRTQGGALGYIGYNTMVQPFGQIAFNLKVNEFTKEPFKTNLGWHIVYVKGKKITPLEDVKQAIENTLIAQKYKEWFETL